MITLIGAKVSGGCMLQSRDCRDSEHQDVEVEGGQKRINCVVQRGDMSGLCRMQPPLPACPSMTPISVTLPQEHHARSLVKDAQYGSFRRDHSPQDCMRQLED